MRTNFLRTGWAVALLAGAAAGADPVRVELGASANAAAAIVTIADVAHVSGGDAALRERVGKLDLLELKPREARATVSRRLIEYRLALAGVDAAEVRVSGEDRVVVERARRRVTPEEVAAAAQAELRRLLPSARIELAQAIVAPLPEAPANQMVAITAKPHAPQPAMGRVQMDVTISSGGQVLLALPVHLEASATTTAVIPAVVRTPSTWPELPGAVDTTRNVTPVSAITPLSPLGGGEVIVRSRQRLAMNAKLGALFVSVPGEALQEGRLGQTISVQNLDSKKTLSARVTGPGTVEVDLGGTP